MIDHLLLGVDVSTALTVIIIGLIVMTIIFFLKTKRKNPSMVSSKTNHHGKIMLLKTPPIISSKIPFLGCALDYLQDPISFLDRVQYEQSHVHREGLFTLKLANKYITMISSMEAIPNFPQFFYNTSEEDISFYNVFNDFFQTILPFNVIEMETFSGKSMKKLKMMQHKIIPKLEDYVEIISFQLQRFFNVENLSKKKDIQWVHEQSHHRSFQFDPMQLFTELVLLINASSIVAKELGTIEEFRERLLQLFPKMNDGLEGIALSLPSAFQVLFPNVRAGRKAFLDFTTLIRDILIARDDQEEQQKNHQREQHTEEIDDGEENSNERLDVLKILSTELRACSQVSTNGQTPSWNEIFQKHSESFQSMCAKLFVMIYAGSTVCKSSAYTLLSVLNHEHCHVKYMNEIHHIYTKISSTSTDCVAFDLPSSFFNKEFVLHYARQAEYAESCVKETLRRFTGPLVLRKVMKPLTLQSHLIKKQSQPHTTKNEDDSDLTECYYQLPMGANHFLALSPYHYHHCSKIFPNPYEFIPERFMTSSSAAADMKSGEKQETFREESIPTLHSFNQGFHAFSAGKHVCLGAKIATIQSKCIVGCMLSLFGGSRRGFSSNEGSSEHVRQSIPPLRLATPLEEPDYSVIGIAKPKKPCYVKCYVCGTRNDS
ncbi:hypothetical protein C9374_001078 [Naegleria lovaniensis]|uniref:Cytochrome P450 n=1 Tax=Naegleria lovaniensis TaxID=51637 RepID=A0AA88GYZ8_NAELO|nr:uncharacterized protein C9374_001078 [Naegleria lovaniensis]KAG2388228.1 hypothetical protein C9374_001078 [Naegleria lovaniensis]